MNVDLGRHYRYQDGMSATGDFRKVMSVDRSRRVDDERFTVLRHSQLPAASDRSIAFETCYAVDRRTVIPSLSKPSCARALGIEIHQGRSSVGRIAGGEIGSDCRLS